MLESSKLKLFFENLEIINLIPSAGKLKKITGRTPTVRNGRFQKKPGKIFFRAERGTFGHFSEKIFSPR